MRSVEVCESVLIGREMRRDPIENDADSALMQDVDHVHQVLRRSVAARRREKAGDLITPRSIERMLHDRHQLDVREVHLARVLRERSSDFAISGQTVLVPWTAPGAEVELVNREWRGHGIA